STRSTRTAASATVSAPRGVWLLKEPPPGLRVKVRDSRPSSSLPRANRRPESTQDFVCIPARFPSIEFHSQAVGDESRPRQWKEEDLYGVRSADRPHGFLPHWQPAAGVATLW